MVDYEKTIFFDMDNTMYDFDGSALRVIPPEKRVAKSQFYANKDYSEADDQLIQAAYNDPDFFDSLEMFEGVIETWEALLKAGYTPGILSSPLRTNPRCIEGKHESLRRTLVPYFGQRVIDEAIFDKEKWRHDGLVMLDDRPDMPRGPNGTDIASWEHVLYGWPHMQQRHFGGAAFRLLDYSEPEALLDIARRVEFARLNF